MLLKTWEEKYSIYTSSIQLRLLKQNTKYSHFGSQDVLESEREYYKNWILIFFKVLSQNSP